MAHLNHCDPDQAGTKDKEMNDKLIMHCLAFMINTNGLYLSKKFHIGRLFNVQELLVWPFVHAFYTFYFFCHILLTFLVTTSFLKNWFIWLFLYNKYLNN